MASLEEEVQAITTMPPSKTLFVKYISDEVPLSETEVLFGKGDPFSGYNLLRKIKGSMAFVDYITKEHAMKAMLKMNGHLQANRQKISVDFDKDNTRVKRARHDEKLVVQEDKLHHVKFECVACNLFCLTLACPIDRLPKRKIDNSSVVTFAKQLRHLDMSKGDRVVIKRPSKGGVEYQWRLCCSGCNVTLAYQAVKHTAPTKHVFLLDGAMREQERRGARGKRMREQQQAAQPPPTTSTSSSSLSSSSSSTSTASSPSPTTPSQDEKRRKLSVSPPPSSGALLATPTTTQMSPSTGPSPHQALPPPPPSPSGPPSTQAVAEAAAVARAQMAAAASPSSSALLPTPTVSS